jgi:hydroxymethylglutaryl-CoA lyase
MVAGVQAGVCLFDTSMGHLGGRPFIPDAAGNIATEDAVHLLDEMGVGTGIDWRSLSILTLEMERRLGRTLPSRMAHLPAAA